MNSNIPLKGADLCQARSLIYAAALQTLARQPQPDALRALREQLLAEREQFPWPAPQASLLPPILAGAPRLTDAVSPDLLGRLAARIAAAAGREPALVRAEAQTQFARLINSGPRWQPFACTFTVGRQEYTSRFIPLNQAFDPALQSHGATGYSSVAAHLPVSAAAPLESRARATNAWYTELQRGGEVLFAAFRSGSFSEPSVQQAAQRQELARGKAADLLRVVVVKHLAALAPAERQAVLAGSRAAEVVLVSTSLLTSFLGLFNHQTLLEHAAALEAHHGRETVFDLPVDGRARPVSARFTIIHFNKAVNELRWVGASRSRLQLSLNAEALRRLRAFKDEALARLAAQPGPAAAARRAAAAQLWRRLARVADRRGGLSSGSGSGYELPALASNLGWRLGAVVHYNCLSGKDRTGLADVEAKLLAIQVDRRLRAAQAEGALERARLVPSYNADLDDEDGEAAVRLLFESGNLDIQQINTGVAGYKVRGSLLGRFGGGRLGRILAAARGRKVLCEYLGCGPSAPVKAAEFSRMINALSIFTGA